MRWSLSASKVFSQCPKKWYYEALFADSKTKEPLRKEAYVLKHLQSVYSWRGKLVDQVITRFVVPKLNRHEQIDIDEVLAYASWLTEAQLTFAKTQLYRNNGTNRTKPSMCNYCALFELEYNGGLADEAIEQAKDEAKSALFNVLNSRLFYEIIEDGLHLIAQRTLQFPFAGVNVKCTPDLIVFFRSKPPTIIDWKVEAPKHKEHWLQLGLYGFALSRVMPHKDFPVEWRTTLKNPTKIDLLEFQLLRNQELHYCLTQDDVIDIEDYIYMSSMRMRQMINGNSKPEVIVNLLPTARSPRICAICKFRKICWREPT